MEGSSNVDVDNRSSVSSLFYIEGIESIFRQILRLTLFVFRYKTNNFSVFFNNNISKRHITFDILRNLTKIIINFFQEIINPK